MDFSLAMFLGCGFAFCIVLFTKVMFISHIILLALPPSRQVTVCNVTVLIVMLLLINMGLNNRLQTSSWHRLRCKSWLSLGVDPPAFRSSEVNVHWGSFNRE